MSDIVSLLGKKRNSSNLHEVSDQDIDSSKQRKTACSLLDTSFRELWKVKGSHLVYNFPRRHALERVYKHKSLRIAAFDMDNTLIATRLRERHFARGPTDWKWYNEHVPNKLSSIAATHLVAIFTNQGGVVASEWVQPSKSLLSFRERVNNFIYMLNLPAVAVCGALKYPSGKNFKQRSSESEHRRTRKPGPGMWLELKSYLNEIGYEIDENESFIVGDAAGREGDFLDSDKGFANVLKLRFFVPEEFFCDDESL